jgi:hypothetical protein
MVSYRTLIFGTIAVIAAAAPAYAAPPKALPEPQTSKSVIVRADTGPRALPGPNTGPRAIPGPDTGPRALPGPTVLSTLVRDLTRWESSILQFH